MLNTSLLHILKRRLSEWGKSICVLAIVLSLLCFSALGVYGQSEPGTSKIVENISFISNTTFSSIDPVVTEVGKISLSIDGLGTLAESGTIQVEKLAGATVRSAYMAAASTGFTGYQLSDGDVKIDGAAVNWDVSIPGAISNWNHWADVTSLVKPKIDAAPAGRVDFNLTEAYTGYIDGEILAVIFNDPSQTVDNTVILFFGAQEVEGDTFVISLASPLDKSDPNLELDMSLGISYGYQGYGQYSIIDVNGIRVSTSAGGQDDGAPANGALLTVGGLDDSNANPADPYATPSGNPRIDDELYDLLPFVETGDTSITIFTQNPSADDGIFFAGLFLASVRASAGEEGRRARPVVVGGEVLEFSPLM
ncbi:MAG: hypothetical protein QXX08_07235, partial [Candidatus Bathyarchaeia archaeon]